MSVSKVSDDLYLAGQLSADDVTRLAGEGIKTFICNRPDGEAADQPARGDLEAAAHAAGASFLFLPLVAGQSPDETMLAEYTELYVTANKPILAFCRTGRRSSMIHSGAQDMIAKAGN